jgi:cyclohexanecarboxylate-CoA ligase
VELENVLARYPGVEAAAIVPYADERLGERCCAVLVFSGDAPPTIESLRVFLTENGLATFKAPERLIFLDQLPRTPSGKVAKQELKALASAPPATREPRDNE